MPRTKEPTFNIDEAGKMATSMTNDLISGIKDLVPIKGMVRIEVNLEISDDNIFKDDERRQAKLIIELEMAAIVDKF